MACWLQLPNICNHFHIFSNEEEQNSVLGLCMAWLLKDTFNSQIYILSCYTHYEYMPNKPFGVLFNGMLQLQQGNQVTLRLSLAS